ncbi:MAG: 1-(5-phosphoribosyl)-5-[Oscillospiraceae bacterium]|nr:1-(5-phosphoribosyl)-5-[(5-phosphoribosylamino)methylideneamino]imidazole-4-carboxamide isomerase [Oscillospiraceae bacterium]
MIVLPAIDLYEGKAVRLYKGDYAQMTVYSADPPALARSFEAAGAEYLHMVDLAGARDGDTPDFSAVAAIAAGTKLKVEIGGGIRTMDRAEKYLAAGVERVILGTAAVTDWDFFCAAVRAFPGRVAAGVDVRDGFVAIRGWREQSAVTLARLCDRLGEAGVRTLICTDISRDGAMNGTNRELYRDLTSRYPELDIVASGGVSSLEDIRTLRDMGLWGAIVGKAYYTGALDLREAMEAAR